MSLVDKLMSIDRSRFFEEETAELKSKNLSKILGEETTVKVKGLDSELYMSIMSRVFDKKGKADYGKSYDSAALIVVEGMVEPNLKDEKFQKYFGAATPKELAKILFKGNEITDISAKIAELSGFDSNPDEDEAEVKN